MICPDFLGGLLCQPRVQTDTKLLEVIAINKALDSLHEGLIAFLVTPRPFNMPSKINVVLSAASSALDSGHQCNLRLINSTR
jgi:hypothetical protein